MPASLHMIDGPRRGERFAMEEGGTLIGRDPAEGIDVALYDPRVSSRHARVVYERSFGWTIEDLGSTNGTRVDGQPIRTPTLLATGSVVRFGEGCSATFEVQTGMSPTGGVSLRPPSLSTPPSGQFDMMPKVPPPGTSPFGVPSFSGPRTVDAGRDAELREAVELLRERAEDARIFVDGLRRSVDELDRAGASGGAEAARVVRRMVEPGGELREMVRDLDEMLDTFRQAVAYFDEKLGS